MSLPLSRRIAQTALLVAAGAVSAVGAAGSANAAEFLPSTKDLGGLSDLDGANLGNTVDETSRSTTDGVGKAGGSTVRKAVPTAGRTVGSAGKTAAPAAQRTAGKAVGTANTLAGKAAKSTAGKKKLPSTKRLPKADSLLDTDKLPLKDLPLS
ncbi:MAG TPA: ATP-binding protein [Streptomyces sp.]|nr:ATP-binding protein [Streptomyces sp.]